MFYFKLYLLSPSVSTDSKLTFKISANIKFDIDIEVSKPPD